MSNYFKNEQNEMGLSDYEYLMDFVKTDASGDDMDWIMGDEWFEDYYEQREVYMRDLYNRLSDSDKKKLEKDSKREYGFDNGFAQYYGF